MKIYCAECAKNFVDRADNEVTAKTRYTCKYCNAAKSMIDGMDLAEIGKTTLARQSAWQHSGSAMEERLRQQDAASRFRRRTGFSPAEWHARIDALGWRCTDCERELTAKTVVRWSLDGTTKLDSQIPLCRSCQGKRVRNSSQQKAA